MVVIEHPYLPAGVVLMLAPDGTYYWLDSRPQAREPWYRVVVGWLGFR